MNNIDDMPPNCHDCPYWEADHMDEFIRKIELILIEAGQHDTEKFRLGEIIRYTPYEISEILREHIDELRNVLT